MEPAHESVHLQQGTTTMRFELTLTNVARVVVCKFIASKADGNAVTVRYTSGVTCCGVQVLPLWLQLIDAFCSSFEAILKITSEQVVRASFVVWLK
jgi:hypothetical protein